MFQHLQAIAVCMKKILSVISIITILAACKNNTKPHPKSPAADPLVNGSGEAHDSTADGRMLIAGNDCVGCHKIDTLLTGPAFLTISKRYPNGNGVAENLARSIISGSRGVFDSTRSMPPHPSIKFADAVKMANYILSLKDQVRIDSANKVR